MLATARPSCCSSYITMQIMLDFSVKKYQTNKYFSTTFRVAGFYTSCSLLQSVLEHSYFLNMEISQGSVATRLRHLFKIITLLQI